MNTPAFWNSRNIVATALLPLSWGYDLARRLRRAWVTPTTLPVPVICVGNITAGGAGKTPVALHIGALLKRAGIRAFFLSRGYGGRLSGPISVDPAMHNAGDVGDEPLLLCACLPTIVSKSRLAGAQYAIAQGAQVIVMDDGFQNPALKKNLSLVVVDGAIGFGNGFLLPAGPLREPLREGLARADALIVINATEPWTLAQGKPVFTAATQPLAVDAVKDRRWLAFCGIAYPQKFFTTLHNLGGHVMATRAFADHHPYMPHEIENLRHEATDLGAQLITTAKDLVRIPDQCRGNIHALEIMLAFDKEEAFANLIFGAVKIT